MELTSMKMSSEEQKEYPQPCLANGSDAPLYPWGLQLHLDEDELAKLALPALPTVGQTMLLHARVEVKSVSQTQSQTEVHRGLQLQITDMALEHYSLRRSTEEVMYGDGRSLGGRSLGGPGTSDRIILEG